MAKQPGVQRSSSVVSVTGCAGQGSDYVTREVVSTQGILATNGTGREVGDPSISYGRADLRGMLSPCRESQT